MARSVVLATAIAASLLAVSGAGGTAAQTPKRGGTVVIAWGGPEFPCLNFLVSPCKEAILPTYGVVEGAFEEGPDNSWQPKLVSHVDVTTKPPFTLTYFIRPEARWSDGVPVTASDFVFTYRARLKYPLQEDDDPYRTRIRSVRALDAKTVRVTLGMRFAFWHQLFSEILPFHALRGENLARIWVDRIDNPRTGRPIGSGPFLVQSWERGRQLTLMRNPAYWGSHRSYLDRIVVRFFAGGPLDPGVVDLFGTNRNAVGQWQFSEPLVTGLDGVPGVTLRFAADAPGWEHLDIRSGKGGHPALRNKLVRRALAYGIDRVAIVRALFGAVGPKLRPLDSAVLRSGDRFYAPNWSGYRYDPGHARRLLNEAGCRRGEDGIYSCAGVRLSLRFVSRGAGDRRVRTLELVQAELRQAGVEVVPLYSSAHDQVLESGDFDVTLFAWFGGGAEDGGINSLYGCGGEQNYTGYCQRLVTGDLDQSDRIFRRTQWARVVNRADAQLAKDVPVIPLYEVPTVAAVGSEVRDFVPSFLDPTWKAENWWLDR